MTIQTAEFDARGSRIKKVAMYSGSFDAWVPHPSGTPEGWGTDLASRSFLGVTVITRIILPPPVLRKDGAPARNVETFVGSSHCRARVGQYVHWFRHDDVTHNADSKLRLKTLQGSDGDPLHAVVIEEPEAAMAGDGPEMDVSRLGETSQIRGHDKSMAIRLPHR